MKYLEIKRGGKTSLRFYPPYPPPENYHKDVSGLAEKIDLFSFKIASNYQ